MKKSEFVAALRKQAPKAYSPTEQEIVLALADHVDSLQMPYGEEHWWGVGHRIGAIVGHAMNKLHTITTTEQLAVLLPEALKDATGSQHIADQASRFINAEWYYINAQFLQFADEVYDRGGLYAKIDKCPQRSMSGTFGETTLRSYVLAGRVMLTFARRGDDEHDKIRATFICDDGDPNGISGGLTNLEAEAWEVIPMLQDVRANWTEQCNNYVASESVSLA